MHDEGSGLISRVKNRLSQTASAFYESINLRDAQVTGGYDAITQKNVESLEAYQSLDKYVKGHGYKLVCRVQPYDGPPPYDLVLIYVEAR